MAVKNGQLEDRNAQLEIKVSRLEALEQRNVSKYSFSIISAIRYSLLFFFKEQNF